MSRGLLTIFFLAFLVPPATAGDDPALDCLRRWMAVRKNPTKSLPQLRKCAEDHPDSAVVQLTLGRRLLKLSRQPGSAPSLALDATAALQRAGDLDPAQLGEDWLPLAGLYLAQGDDAKGLQTLHRSQAYLEPAQVQGVIEQVWDLALKLGEDELALDAWDRNLRYRRQDDVVSVRAAARLLLRAGRHEAASDCWMRVLELDPEDAEAKEVRCRMLLALSEGASSSERKQALDACLPMTSQLSLADLDSLFRSAQHVMRTRQADELAALLLERDAAHARANLLRAVTALDGLTAAGRFRAGTDDQLAIECSQLALRGDLDEDERALAHQTLGMALALRAKTRYEGAGGSATGKLIARTRRAFRDALRHLKMAAMEGASVDHEIVKIERSLDSLGGMMAELDQLKLERRRADCESLAANARRSHETDQPLAKVTRSTVVLAAHAGDEAELGTVQGGAKVRLLDSRWMDGSCWCRVKSSDGTTGWADISSLTDG